MHGRARQPTVVAALLGACMLIAPIVAEAQADSAVGPVVDLRLGAGASVGAGSGRGDVLQPLGMLGVHWAWPSARISGRVELTHEEESTRRFAAACVECASESTNRLTGVQLSGQLDLLRGPLRPYLVSGLGIFSSSSRFRMNFSCTEHPVGFPECVVDPQWRSFGTARNTVLGLHSGAGISLSLGRATIFGEGRYLLLSDGTMARRSRLPLLIGVRF